MPYTDIPPTVVFPDDEGGRFDAANMRRESPGIMLCDRFEKDPSPLRNKWSEGLRVVCRNRETMGEQKHNWCMRCMAGFPVWYGEDTEHRSTVI